MKQAICPVCQGSELTKAFLKATVPAAITLVLAPIFLVPDEQRGRSNEVYLPMSNAPDQPHPPHSGSERVQPTTRIEWGLSGTNTSAALAWTSRTATILVLPGGSDLNVVTRLRQAGLAVDMKKRGQR
jgi:hypothetical protein